MTRNLLTAGLAVLLLGGAAQAQVTNQGGAWQPGYYQNGSAGMWSGQGYVDAYGQWHPTGNTYSPGSSSGNWNNGQYYYNNNNGQYYNNNGRRYRNRNRNVNYNNGYWNNGQYYNNNGIIPPYMQR